MTKREFVKKSIIGVTGIFCLSSFQKFDKFDGQKVSLPERSKKSNSDAYDANMAFGHSLPHTEFNQNLISFLDVHQCLASQ